MRKRIVCILLTLLLLACALPVAAEDMVGPTVQVGGVEMYSDTETIYYKNGDTEGQLTGTAQDYNAKLENKGGVYTLTIQNLLVPGTGAPHYAGIYAEGIDLTINVQGANSVTGGDYESGNSYGIYVKGGSLTISGGGALSVTGGAGKKSYGIYAESGLTISGGTIDAAGGPATDSYSASRGLYCDQTITITGGTVVATGGTVSSGGSVGVFGTNGISVSGGVVVARSIDANGKGVNVAPTYTGTKIAGGDVNSTAVVVVPDRWTNGSAEETKLVFSTSPVTLDKDYYIVNANARALELSNGTTIDTNGRTLLVVSLYNDPSKDSFGIYAGLYNALNFTGSGSVIAVSGSGDNNYGICAATTVSDASVTAIGADSAGYCRGIYGAVTAGGSAKVTAIGGQSTGNLIDSYGINGAVTVNDTASVTAIAGKANGNSYGIANFSPGDVTVNSGTLCAVGGAAGDWSTGIFGNTYTVTIAANTAVNAVGEDYGLRSESEASELAAGSFTGGRAAIKYNIYESRVTDLLATGYCYYANHTMLQPPGDNVGEAYQTITVQKAPPCTVSFHVGQGTLHGTTASITVQPGETYGELPTASTTEEGMKFGGWWTGDGTDGNWGTLVTRDSIVTAGSDHTLYARYGHIHPICGAECSDNAEHENILWTAIGTAEELLAINSDGHYYLTTDLTLEAPWELNNHVALDLNGHTLTGSVEVTGELNFTLTDCTGTGKLSDETENPAVLKCSYDSTFNQYGGTIENTAENGNGIYVYDYHYYGGTVTAGQYAVDDAYTIHLYKTPDIRGGKADFYAESYLPKFDIRAELELPAEACTVDFMDETGTFTFGWDTCMSEADCTRFFTSVNAGTFVEKDVDGELQLTALAFTQQPTEGNDYTPAVNDPNPTWQWYELGTKVFTVDDSSDSEFGIQSQSCIEYANEKRKLTSATGYLKFFHLAKDDIVAVTFDEDHSGTVSGTYINFGAKAGNTWTGTVTERGNVKIDFAGFTGGETFTITVTRKVPIAELTGRTGASLLTRTENALTIMDGREYVCVVNGVLTSEPVTFVHEHGGWAFSYDEASEMITATCGNEGCPLNGGSGTATCPVIIDPNVEYKYLGYTCPVRVDRLDEDSDWVKARLGTPRVTDYRLAEEPLKGTATITVDDQEACTVPFTLQKGTLTAADITVIGPDDSTYSGSAKEVTFSTWGDATHLVTIYCVGEGLVDGKPVNAGDYTVKADVAGSAWYNEVNSLTVGTFTIDPKDISAVDVTVDAIPDQYYTGRDIELEADDITVTYNDKTLALGTDFELGSYSDNKDIGLARAVMTGKGNYTGTRTVYFSIVYATKDAAEVLEWQLADTGWFNATYRPVFTPKTGYQVNDDPRDFSNSIDMGTTLVNALYVQETATGMIYQVAIRYQTDLFIPDIDDVSGNPTEWTGEVTLTVTASDRGDSGLAPEAYSFDGGQTWQAENTKTFTENTGNIVIRVRDAAGNISTDETLSITRIDEFAPIISTVDPLPTGNWLTEATRITVDARDEELGLAENAYSFDGGTTWQSENAKEFGDGEHTVTIWVQDQAGNIATCSPFTLKIDTTAPTAPTVTAKVGETDYTPGEWAAGNIDFTLSAIDEGSGIQKYQVKIGDGAWQDLDGNTFAHTAGTDETGVTYRFRALNHAGHTGEASDPIRVLKRHSYTIAFDAGGGTGTMADMTAYQKTSIQLTENAFTRDGYKFMGWSLAADSTAVDFVDGQTVRDLTDEINGQVTLYAVWTRDIILSGDITAPNRTYAYDLKVTLVGLDGTAYPATVTGSENPYYYIAAVPAGEYQLVVEDTRNQIIVTAKEDLTADRTEAPITLTSGQKNSVVNTEHAGDYTPIIGGLDAVAENTAGTDVTVTLTVTHEAANQSDAEHDALMDAAGSQKNKLVFFEIDLMQDVNGTETPVTDTVTPLEIIMPFDTARKQDFKVYRFHDNNANSTVDEGEVDILTTERSADGEFIEVGNGYVTIHARFFSLYAIGCTDVVIPDEPVVPAHSCTSRCEVCGGCLDEACTESVCKDKCILPGMNFTDVAGDLWYTDAVEYVYHHKMMEGVGNDLFGINDSTSRAMVVTILWRLEGKPVVNYSMQFEDVPAETWYTEAVRWAASEKIVEGHSTTVFSPTDAITREQFAAILYRYAQYKGYDVSAGEDISLLSYRDGAEVSDWAVPAMQWACGSGLMEGDAGTLTPKANATRAQAAVLFHRFCEKVAKN